MLFFKSSKEFKPLSQKNFYSKIKVLLHNGKWPWCLKFFNRTSVDGKYQYSPRSANSHASRNLFFILLILSFFWAVVMIIEVETRIGSNVSLKVKVKEKVVKRIGALRGSHLVVYGLIINLRWASPLIGPSNYFSTWIILYAVFELEITGFAVIVP